MATSYPVTLPVSRVNPGPNDALSSPPHNVQHTDVNDEVTALMAKVGITGSVVTSTLDYRVGQLQGRNRLINGNFAVRQRGNGPFTTVSAYGIDQWRNGGAGTTFSQTATQFTPGEIPGVAESGYHFKTVVTSVVGAGNYNSMVNFIENVETMAGQVVTLSFYAKASGALPIAVEFLQLMGTGGAPSADVTGIGITKVTLSTSWVRYSFNATMPSLTGKTLGTTPNTSSTAISIWFDAGSTFNARTNTLGQQSGTFYVWGVQVEAGANATPFEQEHISVTLSKCQRYFQRIPGGVAGSTTSSTATLAYCVVAPKVPFRLTPTLTSTGAWVVQEGASPVTATALALNSNASANTILIDVTVAAGLTAKSAGFLYSGTTIDLTAEL